MAIEKVIPKDTRQYKPKLIGFLTTRQTLCIIPAVVLAVIIFFALGELVTTETKLFIIMVVAIPFILVGWYEPYGLPFEKFAQTVLISMVLAPKYRKYKTNRLLPEDPVHQEQAQQPPKKKKSTALDPELKAYK